VNSLRHTNKARVFLGAQRPASAQRRDVTLVPVAGHAPLQGPRHYISLLTRVCAFRHSLSTKYHRRLHDPNFHERQIADMRISSITAACALLLAGASALEKPLDIQVEKSVECKRKTQRGMSCRSTTVRFIS